MTFITRSPVTGTDISTGRCSNCSCERFWKQQHSIPIRQGYWMQDKGGGGRNTIDGEYQKAFTGGSPFANGRWDLNKS